MCSYVFLFFNNILGYFYKSALFVAAGYFLFLCLHSSSVKDEQYN